MKRREFIVSSALAIGAGAILGGCGSKKDQKTASKVL